MFNRLRYINANFGKILTNFLEASGSMVKDEAEDQDTLELYGGKYNGKLSKLNTSILFFSKFNWKLIIYFISFCMRFYTKSIVR
jgi:hypothetical protein